MKNNDKVSEVDVQVENGFLRIANEIRIAFERAKLNGSEWTVLISLCGFIWGWGKTSEIVTARQIASETELELRTVRRSLKTLEEKGIIFGKKSSIIVEGFPLNIYSINKAYDKWRLPRIVTTSDKNCHYSDQELSWMEQNFVTIDTKNVTPFKEKKERKERKENNYNPDVTKKLLKEWNEIEGVGKNELTSSLQNLVSEVLDLVSEKDLIDAVDNYKKIINNNAYFYNYKFKSMTSAKNGLRGFLQLGLEKPDAGFRRFLSTSMPYDKLKSGSVLSRGSYFDEVRLNHRFFTLDFDLKSPLNVKTNTYMGVSTDKLDRYDIYNTLNYEVLRKIKEGTFKPEYYCGLNGGWIKEGNSRFRLLEECMVYLIRWKEERKRVFKEMSNEELLKKLIKHHINTRKEFGYE